MRRVLKVVGVLLLTAVLAGGVLILLGSRNLKATYDIQPETIRIPSDSASVTRGARLVGAYGCTECHGPELSGTNFIEGMPFMDLPAPNLTPAGVGAKMNPALWERAIRHGVGYDGRPLVIMPSEAFNGMSNEDLGAVLAYLRTVPPHSSDLEERKIGPVGRIVAALHPNDLIMARTIDHAAPHTERVQVEETAAYGAYLIPLCTGCHGPELRGGPIPGEPDVVAPALGPPAAAIAGWSRDDFFRALRLGTKPDGSKLSDNMPWRAFGRMNDTELGAIWLYIQGLPSPE